MAMGAAVGGLMLAMGSAGQGVQGNGSRTVDQSTPVGPIVPDTKIEKMDKDQERQMNADRQKKLVEDTVKLLEMANELKAAVDKSNKDTLSLDVVRKADAIEKLAHSVKEGMKGN
jgi:nitric oxide reductase activation protein